MANAKKCDRCGAYYDVNTATSTKGKYIRGVNFVRTVQDWTTDYRDLCDSCMHELQVSLDDPIYAPDIRIDSALDIAYLYASIDGAHHKDWVIDQMVKALCGTFEIYDKWVAKYYEDTECDWSEGVAP